LSLPFLLSVSFISTRWIGKERFIYINVRYRTEKIFIYIFFISWKFPCSIRIYTSLHLQSNLNLIPPPYLFPVHMSPTYPYVLHVHVILNLPYFRIAFHVPHSFVGVCPSMFMLIYAFLLHVSAIPPLNAFHASLICVTIGS